MTFDCTITWPDFAAGLVDELICCCSRTVKKGVDMAMDTIRNINTSVGGLPNS